jgi:anthranilate phosphoribosyltransferase
MELSPEDFGFRRQPGDGITGGDVEKNCAIAESILNGDIGPARDIVLMNAALALVAAGAASDFREGVMRAEESIDSGAARGKLNRLRELCSL